MAARTRRRFALVRRCVLAVSMLVAFCMATPQARATDAGFARFVESVWPDAHKAGVTRATFEAQTRGLEPDYKLPDLLLPGRPATGAPSQAEFVQVPAAYVKEATIARLAGEGRKLMQQHRATLAAIEKRFGVPGSVILAIWSMYDYFAYFKREKQKPTAAQSP